MSKPEALTVPGCFGDLSPVIFSLGMSNDLRVEDSCDNTRIYIHHSQIPAVVQWLTKCERFLKERGKDG